jgi:hypothetical protein
MLVREAMEIARQWVRQNAEPHPHFRGAYFSGSILDQPDDTALPESSDVDVVIVLARMPDSHGRTKFRVNGVLIEVTHLAMHELDDTRHVARTFYLAHSFRSGAIIADPTGHLRHLHEAITADFDQPSQILVRCNDVFEKMHRRLVTPPLSGSWAEQILSWMFPATLSAVAMIVAGKMNPTVRTRYLAAQKVLYSRCMTSSYEDLLELLGCREVFRDTVQHYLNGLAQIFDTAAAIGGSDFPFSCDIAPDARSIAIGGSQQLIDAGHHREAVFWIVATHARCVQILNAACIPAVGPKFADPVSDLLRIREPRELDHRRNQVLSFIPTIRGVVRGIVAAKEI